MSYKVVIRNNETGEIRIRENNLPWYDHSFFWWTDGNFGCDCNREWEFQRAGNEQESEHPECGNTRYTVIKALFEDGTEVLIDDADETP